MKDEMKTNEVVEKIAGNLYNYSNNKQAQIGHKWKSSWPDSLAPIKASNNV